jgi:hypothetical protein
VVQQDIDFKEPEPLAEGFTDNQYWKLNMYEEDTLSNLLADYEQ